MRDVANQRAMLDKMKQESDGELFQTEQAKYEMEMSARFLIARISKAQVMEWLERTLAVTK